MHIYTQPQRVNKYIFLHDQQWISLWIKPISNELDITIQVIASQLFGHCDVINKQLWPSSSRMKTERVRHGDDVKRSSLLSPFMDSFCWARNEMYVLSWRTASALTWVLFRCLFPSLRNCFCTHLSVVCWCLFPSLLCNLGIKHQSNPLVSTETVRHSSTYIILYIIHVFLYWDSTDVTGDKVDLYDSCVVMLGWLRNERL